MVKLSQRAWNNVIIVSMLVLVMLFNFSSNFLNGASERAPSVITLVPIGMTITTIEFEGETVERIGQGWRSTSGERNNDSLSILVKHWNSAQLRLFKGSIDGHRAAASIILWFAGQTLPVHYQFIQSVDETLVKIDGQTYELLNASYPELMLME